MTSCGKAQNPDAIRINAPFLGISPYDAHGALGILQRRGMLLAVLAARNPVLEQYPRHSKRIQPFADLGAF